MSETFILPRDGQRPIRFVGERLAEEDGRWWQGRDQNRWYVLALYRLDDGRYAASWQYKSLWQGEEEHDAVTVSSTLRSVVTDLEDFDPTAWVEGYRVLVSRYGPDQETPYRERQETLLRGIAARYRAQVSRLCQAVQATEDVAEDA